jgi:MYXO-CTERM domain-containing protein
MKALMTLATLALVAGTASAQISVQVPTSQISAAPMDGYTERATPAVVYSSLPGPYSAFAAATGPAGFDDYTTTQPAEAMRVASLKFVGGVTTVGGGMTFNFYDSGATLYSTASLALPSAGDFIWTITFGPGNGSTSTFAVPTNGFMEIIVAAGTTGRWFFTPTAPTVGGNNIAVGTGGTLAPQRYSAFELSAVPAPGALALLGLGGLVATRRRR